MYQKLKDERKARGDTCETMAKLLNLKTKSAYSKKENGLVPFTVEECKTIAKHYRKKIEELF